MTDGRNITWRAGCVALCGMMPATFVWLTLLPDVISGMSERELYIWPSHVVAQVLTRLAPTQWSILFAAPDWHANRWVAYSVLSHAREFALSVGLAVGIGLALGAVMKPLFQRLANPVAAGLRRTFGRQHKVAFEPKPSVRDAMWEIGISALVLLPCFAAFLCLDNDGQLRFYGWLIMTGAIGIWTAIFVALPTFLLSVLRHLAPTTSRTTRLTACSMCGYDLSRSPQPVLRCNECGTVFETPSKKPRFVVILALGMISLAGTSFTALHVGRVPFQQYLRMPTGTTALIRDQTTGEVFDFMYVQRFVWGGPVETSRSSPAFQRDCSMQEATMLINLPIGVTPTTSGEVLAHRQRSSSVDWLIVKEPYTLPTSTPSFDVHGPSFDRITWRGSDGRDQSIALRFELASAIVSLEGEMKFVGSRPVPEVLRGDFADRANRSGQQIRDIMFPVD